jgi:hypothetical protein
MNFGNILIVYETDDHLLLQVEAIILEFDMEHERFENSFFILTDSRTKTVQMVNAVRALGVEFGFFLNAEPTGSFFRSQGINDVSAAKIKRILGV